MKITSQKSKEIIISFAQDGNFRSTIPNIKIDGRDVTQVCHAKLLGVTISQDLTWNKHVDTRSYCWYTLVHVISVKACRDYTERSGQCIC